MNGVVWRLTYQFVCDDCRRKHHVVALPEPYELAYPCEVCKMPTKSYRKRPYLYGRPIFFDDRQARA